MTNVADKPEYRIPKGLRELLEEFSGEVGLHLASSHAIIIMSKNI